MLWQDIRHAVRRLAKDRSLTFMAVAALSLGIGANSTVFTFVNAVLIRGLPFEEPDEIMHLATRLVTEGQNRGVSYPDFEDWREQTTTFTDLAAFTEDTANLSDNDHAPERVSGSLVTANTFRILHQPVLLGRDFLPEDSERGAERVVILGYEVWQNRYDGDPNVIGQMLRVNEEPSIIVGVMPEGMKFPELADTWQPLQPTDQMDSRDSRELDVFGRLAPGVDRDQAQAELSAIAGRLTLQYPDTNTDFDAVVQTFNEWANGGQLRVVFLTLMGAVAFVLLIACTNVANLLLARSAHRAREVAVRVSLGASRWRVVRQLLLESLVLGVLAGVFGLALSTVGVRLFDLAVADVGKPYWIQFTMDWRVFTFLGLVCLATSVVFGLAPALHLSRTNVNAFLQEGGRSGTGGKRVRRMSGVMVVVKVMLTVVLLAGAGLMMRSFLMLYQLDLGVDDDRVLTARVQLVNQKYPEPEQRVAFIDALTERLQAMPGVSAASIASHLPLNGGDRRTLAIDGRPTEVGTPPPQVSVVEVGDDYLASLGLETLLGRGLTRGDGVPGSEAVVVNARFVVRFLDGEEVLGHRIRLDSDEDENNDEGTASPWMTIVGVSPTVRQTALQETEPDAVVYRRHRLAPGSSLAIQVYTSGDPSALVPQVREAVRAVDRDLPIYEAHTLAEELANERWPFRVFGSMFGIFALIALVLSAVGIYAVTAYSITQRTQEIGLRMALGAQPGQVVWFVMRRGLVQLAIGLAFGLFGAAGVGQLMEGLPVQISPTDPTTLATILLVLSAVTVLACLGPARRASLLDPADALRLD